MQIIRQETWSIFLGLTRVRTRIALVTLPLDLLEPCHSGIEEQIRRLAPRALNDDDLDLLGAVYIPRAAFASSWKLYGLNQYPRQAVTRMEFLLKQRIYMSHHGLSPMKWLILL